MQKVRAIVGPTSKLNESSPAGQVVHRTGDAPVPAIIVVKIYRKLFAHVHVKIFDNLIRNIIVCGNTPTQKT